MQRVIACVLCACLVWASVPAPVWSEDKPKTSPQAQKIDPKEAKKFFDANNIFKGADDPLRTYFFDKKSGGLTAIGEILYSYLKADIERKRDFKAHFEALRQAGPATDKQLQAAETARGDVQQRFGEMFKLFEQGDGSVDNAFLQSALLSVSFDGAVKNADAKALTQLDTDESFVFMDSEGVSVRMAKNKVCRHKDWEEKTESLVMTLKQFEKFKGQQESFGEWQNWLCGEGGGVTTFSRDLQKRQKEMNQNRPACAQPIPVTGRYNYEMLQYSWCLLSTDVENSQRAYKIDMMVRLARLTGEQFMDDQFLDDHKNGNKLYNFLRAKAAKEKLDKYDALCGRKVVSVLDLVECKMTKRKEYVDKASEQLKAYKARTEGFKGRQVISEAEIASLQTDEAGIRKFLTLGYVETQRNQAQSQLEGVNFELLCKKDDKLVQVAADNECVRKGAAVVRVVPGDSPDSERLRKAIEEGPFSDDVKKKYMSRAQDIADRLGRLFRVFGEVEDKLIHANQNAPMGEITAALTATQKELTETGLDLRIFTSIPLMAQLGNKEDDGWKRWVALQTSKGVNELGKLFGANWREKYLKDRSTLQKYLPIFSQVAAAIAAGDFGKARELLLQLSPEAVRGNWSVTPGESGEDPSRGERVESVLQSTNDTVTRLMREHMYWDIGLDIVKWSVAMAVFAPVASAALSGISRTMISVANAAAKIPKIGKYIAIIPRVIGGIAEHTAIRLQSLSPHASRLRQETMLGRMAMAATVRAVNTGVRLGAFSLALSGGMSGGINWAMYQKDQLLGHDRTPYGSGGKAFVEGWAQGAKWATESWHPMLLFSGVPSSAFEETPLAGITKSLADRGLLGNAAAVGDWGKRSVGGLFGKNMAAGNLMDDAMQWMMKRGGGWTGVATVTSMADQMAKYTLISQGAGFLGREISFRTNSLDRDDVERRIKRAQSEGMSQMQAPWWLLVPVFSAKNAVHVEAQQRSQHGFSEYKKSNELHRIANSAEGAELPMRTLPTKNAMSRLFEFQLMRERPADAKFRVTKDLKYEAIRLELIDHVTGGAKYNPTKGPDFGKINPNRFLEIANQEEGKAGRLHASDEVRDQAQALFEESILKRQDLAANILKAKPGSSLAGFGRVRLGTQEDVATILLRADMQGKGKVSRTNLDAAKSIVTLKAHTESQELVAGKAKDMLDAMSANKKPSAAFQQTIENLLEQTTQWKRDNAPKTYQKLVEDFRADVAKRPGLTAQEGTVLNRMFDYIEAIDKRFNYFNRVQTATQRADTALAALLTEYKDAPGANAAVTQMMDKMAARIKQWGAAQPNVQAPVGATYGEMVEGFRKEVSALKLEGRDRAILESAVKELEAAPWLLRDSKGSILPGWRPAQFEGLMHFLDLIAHDGAPSSNVIRAFLRMGTGTGKTLIAFEGMLPVAEADAVRQGLKGGTVFLTVQSNLESQARIEFRSLKKVLSKMEIDTWEGFKSKIAQGKLEFKGGADDYWILGDEMDGAALQPALTIGEQTASISKRNHGYDILKKMGDRMRELLGQPKAAAAKDLEYHVGRQEEAVQSMKPGETRTQLEHGMTKLHQLSKSLSRLQSEFFEPSLNKQQALQRAEGMVKNLNSSGKLAQRHGGAASELTALMDELKTADGPKAQQIIDRLDGRMRQVWKADNQVSITRTMAQLDNVMTSNQKLTTGMDPEMAKTFRDASGEIKKTLTSRDAALSTHREFALKQFETLVGDQRAILNQTDPQGLAQARSLQKMAKTARHDGNAAQAVKLEAQAKEILQGTAEARKAMDANGREILKVMKEGGAGWEVKVRDLVTKREAIVDRSVVHENRIYETFRSMRSDMFSLVQNKTRTTQVRDVIDAAPEKAAQALESAGNALTKDAIGLVRRYRSLVGSGQGGPEAAAKLAQAEQMLKDAWSQRRVWQGQAKDLRELLNSKPQDAKHAALFESHRQLMGKLQGAETELLGVRRKMADVSLKLEAAKVGNAPETAKLQAELDGLAGRMKEMEGSVSQNLDSARKVRQELAGYQNYELELVRKNLLQLQTQAAEFRKVWEPKLAGFEGTEVSSIRSQLASAERSWQPQLTRLDWNPDRAVRVLHNKIAGVSTTELVVRQALKWTGVQFTLNKILGGTSLGQPIATTDGAVARTMKKAMHPVTAGDVGLTRKYAWELMKAFISDPFIAPEVRWKMFWTLMPSTISPRGLGGRGSWVMTEMLNLAKGYTDNPGNIRMDNITGKINVVHNGQWFDSMDTPTRRYWEVEYNSDLTLPYEHKTMVTMNDFIKDNLNVRFAGFSGTAGKEFAAYVSRYNVKMGGVGSEGAKDVPLEVHSSPSGKIQAIGQAMKDIRGYDAAQVAAGKQANGLVVLSLPDTRMLKTVRKYLIRTGQIKPNEIAMVFSDSEFLRLNRPQANVARQMNLDALKEGTVKLLMLDTRVGGRGLDLNFKGKGSMSFNGYHRYKMLIIDPQLASEAHYIQAQGRIDTGRIPKGSVRDFAMVMDVGAAQQDPVFRRMLTEEPLFQQLRQNPQVINYASKNGHMVPDWSDIHAFITDVKAAEAGSGVKGEVPYRYEQVLKKYLAKKQVVVEQDQLRSASVLQDAGLFDPMMHGLMPAPQLYGTWSK